MIRTRIVLRCLAAIALAGVLGVAGACQKNKTKDVTIVDDSSIRLSDALRLTAEGDKAQAAAMKAKAAYNQKEWIAQSDKAVDLYRQALAKSNSLAPAWNGLGVMLTERMAYMDAAECFKSAAEAAPADPRPFYNIGVIYQKTLHDREALDYYLKSLARNDRYLLSLRGATATGRILDVTDEAALKRVRLALMIETDPKWRSIFESEALRIEGSLARSAKGISSKGL